MMTSKIGGFCVGGGTYIRIIPGKEYQVETPVLGLFLEPPMNGPSSDQVPSPMFKNTTTLISKISNPCIQQL